MGSLNEAGKECVMKPISFALSVAVVFLVSVGTTAAQTTPTPVKWESNGHWYEVIIERLTWEDARVAAESRMWQGVAGHLATITSQDESDFIEATFGWDLFSSWLGGYQDPPDHPVGDENWHWITGEPWVYTNWAPGEPNDTGIEYYLEIHGWHIPQWNDNKNLPMEAYVVEYEGPPSFSCTGFEPPMASGPVTVRANRALPLKAELLDCSVQPVTDQEVSSPPVVQIWFDPGFGAPPIDVTGDALPAGHGDNGNQFVFTGSQWQYNLKTMNYSAVGTYTITMASGDDSEYIIDPSCEAAFERHE